MNLKHFPQVAIKSVDVLVAGIALAGAAYGGRMYWQYHQELPATEAASQAADKLNEIAQIYGLLRQIDTGRTGDARQSLRASLLQNVRSIEPLLVRVDQGTYDLGVNVCSQAIYNRGALFTHHLARSRQIVCAEKRRK